MTQTEYEQKKLECWEEYKRENLYGDGQWKPVSRYDMFCAAFDRAYALGKQEKDADAVISGWVARDEDGSLHLFTEIPTLEFSNARKEHWWYSESSSKIDSNLFPDLTWESEPQEVEIIIKRKKNG